MMIMTLIVAANALSRYLLNNPLTQVEEIATTMFVWLIFIGASVCYKEKMHIGIDCFVGMLPLFLQRVVQILVDLLLIVVNAFMTYLSWLLTISAVSKLTPILRMPYSYIDIAAVIGFGLMTIYSIQFFIEDIRGDASAEFLSDREED